MSNGNTIVIKGGSIKIKYQRSKFDKKGDEDHSKNANATLTSLTINNGTPITLTKNDEIVIKYS